MRAGGVVLVLAALVLLGLSADVGAEPGRRPVAVQVEAPEAVAAGASVHVTGEAPGPPREVRLQLRGGTAWSTVARGRTTTTGRFRLPIPTGWYGVRRLRVVAVRTASAGPVESPVFRVRVEPPYRPTGRAASWNYFGARVWRFDPCRPIGYRINPRRLPEGARPLIGAALRRVSRGSGLRFRYDGPTRAVPFRTEGPSTDPRSPLVFAWSTPRLNPDLLGILGRGGPTDGTWVPSAQAYRTSAAGVVLNRRADTGSLDFADGRSLGATLMHEIGHAVGLGHVASRDQLMNFSASPSIPARFGRGDLNGLRQVGRDAGCL